jgi:hypothetical protein
MTKRKENGKYEKHQKGQISIVSIPSHGYRWRSPELKREND